MDDIDSFDALDSLYDPTLVGGISYPSAASAIDSSSPTTTNTNTLLGLISPLLGDATTAYTATQTAGTQQAQASAAQTGALASLQSTLSSNSSLLIVGLIIAAIFGAMLIFRRK